MEKEISLKLQTWYKKIARPLPWRESKDPYLIWISEIMLQQTTVAAVVPYYNKFVGAFPTVESLAQASPESVLKHWAGLGYYSRARNLHKAAKALSEQNSLPQSWKEWIQLPGIGDYTSRAISSIAFDEKVGVVDGNVIRLLSRFYNLDLEWWKAKEKRNYQNYADQLAQHGKSSLLNQALMEMGATVCTPKSPSCFKCPIVQDCLAHQKNKVNELPLAKPKTLSISLLWEPYVQKNKKKLTLIDNDYCPFLKGQKIFPGKITVLKSKPQEYDFQHAITKYKIYVKLNHKKPPHSQQKLSTWKPQEIRDLSPFSLIHKCLDFIEKPI